MRNVVPPVPRGANSFVSFVDTAFQFLLLNSFTSPIKRASSSAVQSFEVYAPVEVRRGAGCATATAVATCAALPDALAAALPALANILSPFAEVAMFKHRGTFYGYWARISNGKRVKKRICCFIF